MSDGIVERNYCKKCRVFSVLPNHCDNCGGQLSIARLTWRDWREAAKLVLLLVGFFLTGVLLGVALMAWSEFTQ
jgi:hypothetical protein